MNRQEAEHEALASHCRAEAEEAFEAEVSFKKAEDRLEELREIGRNMKDMIDRFKEE